MDKLLTRKEVEGIIKLSRSSIYAMLALGEFPKPIKVGKRAVRFNESEIRSWVNSRR